MSQSEKVLFDSIAKLTEQLSFMEEKVDKFTDDLGTVQAKVDLAMTSISLVQQEQVNIAKLLSVSAEGQEASWGPPPPGAYPFTWRPHHHGPTITSTVSNATRTAGETINQPHLLLPLVMSSWIVLTPQTLYA
jgi:hypothetical protein